MLTGGAQGLLGFLLYRGRGCLALGGGMPGAAVMAPFGTGMRRAFLLDVPLAIGYFWGLVLQDCYWFFTDHRWIGTGDHFILANVMFANPYYGRDMFCFNASIFGRRRERSWNLFADQCPLCCTLLPIFCRQIVR